MKETSTGLWTRRRFGTAAMATVAMLSKIRSLSATQPSTSNEIGTTGPNSLRAHATAHALLFGAAVNPALLDLDGLAAGNTTDSYTRLLVDQAGIVVAENAMKWAALRPSPDNFDFGLADKLMRFAALASQKVRGHNLCWHEALPGWFAGYANKDNSRKLLVDHIQAVAGRYRGQIHSWDVVNEAVEPKDGRPDGLRNSPWLSLAGPDYIELAFQTAASVDPAAKLTYNDYDIELDTAEQSAKRGAVLLLLRRLKARNVPIHAVGLQSHLKADGPEPGPGLVAFIREVKKMGLEVFVTEMDVNTHSLEGGPVVQDAAVTRVYRDYLGLVLAEANVSAVLTWGITSAHTWLNESRQPWARRPDGARQRPLPFDDNLRPTPVFAAIRDAIDSSRALTPASVTAPTIEPSDLYKPFPVQGSPTTQPQAPPVPPSGRS